MGLILHTGKRRLRAHRASVWNFSHRSGPKSSLFPLLLAPRSRLDGPSEPPQVLRRSSTRPPPPEKPTAP